MTVNSSVNFLIYCLVGKKFRTILVQMLPCCRRRRGARPDLTTDFRSFSRKESNFNVVLSATGYVDGGGCGGRSGGGGGGGGGVGGAGVGSVGCELSETELIMSASAAATVLLAVGGTTNRGAVPLEKIISGRRASSDDTV